MSELLEKTGEGTIDVMAWILSKKEWSFGVGGVVALIGVVSGEDNVPMVGAGLFTLGLGSWLIEILDQPMDGF